MPVDMAWHRDLPVLIVTYHGELTAKAYRAMCKERAAALQEGPDAAVVVADMRDFAGFPDAGTVNTVENVLHHDTVRGLIIVVASDVFNRLRNMAVDDPTRRCYVYFYGDMETALATAHQLLS